MTMSASSASSSLTTLIFSMSLLNSALRRWLRCAARLRSGVIGGLPVLGRYSLAVGRVWCQDISHRRCGNDDAILSPTLGGASMAVISLTVRQHEPYQDGQPFGETGAYERIDGTLHFAVPR